MSSLQDPMALRPDTFEFSNVLLQEPQRMRYASRTLGPLLAKAAKAFPAVVLTGPRRE